MKLLIIEDDEIQHELLNAIFEQIDVQGLFCTTGEAGLEKLSNHYFDAVLLDLGLPGKSGLQVLRSIRDNPMLHELPVIVLTATKTRESLQQCMKLGISDYIGKPYQLQQFAQKLELLKRSLALRSATAGKPETAKVLMERLPAIVKFTFGGTFNDESVRKCLSIYTTAFKSLTKTDSVLFNLAPLPNMNEPQVRMFKLIIDGVEPKKPLIVAGRSYGPLVAVLADYDSQLYLIEEDALEYLNSK